MSHLWIICIHVLMYLRKSLISHPEHSVRGASVNSSCTNKPELLLHKLQQIVYLCELCLVSCSMLLSSPTQSGFRHFVKILHLMFMIQQLLSSFHGQSSALILNSNDNCLLIASTLQVRGNLSVSWCAAEVYWVSLLFASISTLVSSCIFHKFLCFLLKIVAQTTDSFWWVSVFHNSTSVSGPSNDSKSNIHFSSSVLCFACGSQVLIGVHPWWPQLGFVERLQPWCYGCGRVRMWAQDSKCTWGHVTSDPRWASPQTGCQQLRASLRGPTSGHIKQT